MSGIRKWLICAGFIPVLMACAETPDAPRQLTVFADVKEAVEPKPAAGEACNGIYGNPPSVTASSPQGMLASLYPVELSCPLGGGEYLTWKDSMGTPREACLRIPPQASSAAPLPLLVFLHGSLFPGDPQTVLTGFDRDFLSADLSADPARPGFILLMVEGRDKRHHYPYPDDHAWGYDNWYRNFDRSDPDMNVDAATIDHFIDQVLKRGIVDDNRLYLTGWSNGAAMAMLYALNTPGIAATAVYSNPDPFTDVEDPCAQEPFGNNLRPIMTIHNDCDIIGICMTGAEALRDKMRAVMPQVEYQSLILDGLGNAVDACDASCGYDSSDPLSMVTIGAVRHLIWPRSRNADLYRFLRDRPWSDQVPAAR